LARALGDVAWKRATRTIASTVTGALVENEEPAILLARQLTSPVRFMEAVAAARPLADLWIEVGPGSAVGELAGDLIKKAVVPLDAGGPLLAGLLTAAAAAFVAGIPVRLSALFDGRFTRPLDLERPLVFIANPCESAPVPSRETVDLLERAVEPAV